MPSVNFTPCISFGNWLCPSSDASFSGAPSISLNTIASAVLFERQPFERIVRWTHGGEGAFKIGFVVRKCIPVFGGEVVEREQRVAILRQAIDGLVVFGAVALDEGIQSHDGILLCLGHPDFLQRALGLRMQVLRQLV